MKLLAYIACHYEPRVIIRHHLRYTELSRHKGVQRDPVHDFIPGHDAGQALESDCCDCYKGSREWSGHSGRYLISAISRRWPKSPPSPANSLPQNSDQDKILSFLANSPQTRDPGL